MSVNLSDWGSVAVVPVAKLGSSHGCTSKIHSERADHERMAAPMRFERDAPIRRNAAEQPGPVERIDAQRVLLVEPERPVSRQFEIEQVVDHRVGADAADMRGKRALDDRAGGGRGRKRRYGVGEGPRRRGVPQILNGRIVVGGDAVDEVKRPNARGLAKRTSVLSHDQVCSNWSAGVPDKADSGSGAL